MTEHHNTGKQHALKGSESRSAFIHMRVEPDFKNRCVTAASGQGMKLSEWIEEACTDKLKLE